MSVTTSIEITCDGCRRRHFGGDGTASKVRNDARAEGWVIDRPAGKRGALRDLCPDCADQTGIDASSTPYRQTSNRPPARRWGLTTPTPAAVITDDDIPQLESA